MSGIVKVGAAAIAAAVCAVVVRKQAPELALTLAACAGAVILLYCSGALRAVVELMDKLMEKEGGEEQILNHMLLKQLLEYLNKEERRLIYLRYFANQTQTQVGTALGISQVQVSRMEKKILKNLRERI